MEVFIEQKISFLWSASGMLDYRQASITETVHCHSLSTAGCNGCFILQCCTASLALLARRSLNQYYCEITLFSLVYKSLFPLYILYFVYISLLMNGDMDLILMRCIHHIMDDFGTVVDSTCTINACSYRVEMSAS